MFWHEFVYEIRRLLRQKEELFWMLMFPVILGTLFYFAFGSINNTTENFHTIPVAVCRENGADNRAFTDTLTALCEETCPPYFDVSETDFHTAKKLLQENKVRGIFRIGEEVTLLCASVEAENMNSTLAIEQSILEMFFQDYRASETAVTELIAENPAFAQEMPGLLETVSYGSPKKLTDGNLDNTVQYFYNLIAMACLFTSFAGAYIAMNNQANLSALGARKCISPCRKSVSVAAQFGSGILTQFVCLAVPVVYLVYVLGIKFGVGLPLLFLTVFAGCVTGVAFGFFVGCIGKVAEGTKVGILVSSSLFCCFLSGLMFGNMRNVVEKFCPFLNVINPAVRISDSFLTLNIYGVNGRYFGNLFALFLMAAVFLAAGCMMIRRKTYASI